MEAVNEGRYGVVVHTFSAAEHEFDDLQSCHDLAAEGIRALSRGVPYADSHVRKTEALDPVLPKHSPLGFLAHAVEHVGVVLVIEIVVADLLIVYRRIEALGWIGWTIVLVMIRDTTQLAFRLCQLIHVARQGRRINLTYKLRCQSVRDKMPVPR